MMTSEVATSTQQRSDDRPLAAAVDRVIRGGLWQRDVIAAAGSPSASSSSAITLAAPGAVPAGLGSTGNPVFNVPASLLGIPAVSLPVLSTEGLPLGLQFMRFAGGDAGLFATAAAIRELLLP